MNIPVENVIIQIGIDLLGNLKYNIVLMATDIDDDDFAFVQFACYFHIKWNGMSCFERRYNTFNLKK